MEKKINYAELYKDKVIAEIERRIQFFTEASRNSNSNSDIVIALYGLKSFIDTID